MTTETPKQLARKRIISFFLALFVFLSTFMSLVDPAYAGTTAGHSTSISAIGATKGINGGVSHIEQVSFRVGISADKDLYNPMDNTYVNMRRAYSHKFPTNNNSVFFVPADYANLYNVKLAVGTYNSGARSLEQDFTSKATNRIVKLTQTSGMPYNKGKNTTSGLNGHSFLGKMSYKKLVESGEWKTKANIYSKEDGIALWSWILQPTSKSGKTATYDVENRIKQYISQHANKKSSDMTDAEKEDVGRGFLALLFATRAVMPTDQRAAWDNAIKSYMNNDSWTETPITIVIDTAITISYTTEGTRTVLPTLDYFMYYTAVNKNMDLYNGGKTLPSNIAGDTYKMLDYIVDQTIQQDGKVVDRISNLYDAKNPFSHGATAIAYPKYRYTTVSQTSGNWVFKDSYNAAIMDVLELGVNPSGSGGKIRGFMTVGGDLKFPLPTPSPTPDIPILTPPPPPPACPEDPSKCPEPDPDSDILFRIPDEFKAPYVVSKGSDVIGVATPLILTHNAKNTDVIQAWDTILANNPQNLYMKVTWDRVVKPTGGATNPVTPNRGHINGFALYSAGFKEWLRGAEMFTIVDNATLTEPIANDSTEDYVYTPTISIEYTFLGQQREYRVTANSDYSKFYRQPADAQIEPIVYTSTPKNYVEVKHESPDNEQFDAMSGVPSNKRLYVGVGGSEFIVDVELEYKQDTESVWRTYRSYYSGVADEFKAGDTAPTITVADKSVTHTGGTFTKTWSGTIPWTGTASSSGWNGGGVTNSWDYSDRDAALTEIQQYIAQVNAVEYKHTSASDKVTRTFKAWGATRTGDTTEGTAGTWTRGSAEVKESGIPGQPGYVAPKPQVDATHTEGTAGSYSYTVTFSMPAHEVCGPNCMHDLPMVEDTWKQKISFDYMKISKVEVYRLEEGRVTNLGEMLGSANSTLKATTKEGQPNIFFNIAQQNANGDDVAAQSSQHGRIRYSLDWSQHDKVIYSEGVRSNKSDGMGDNGSSKSPKAGGHNNSWAKGILYTNNKYTETPNVHLQSASTKSAYSDKADAIDVATPEWKKFDERRKAKNKATIISDMLILQTSSGDQSVIYFAKDSKEIQAQEQFEPVKATQEEMWNNNPNSAAKWTKNSVNLGSYNGNFNEAGTSSSTNRKYWGYNLVSGQFINNAGNSENTIATRFDNNGVGVNAGTPRPTRPDKLYIWENASIIPTTPNGVYNSGVSDVFYRQILTYETKNPYPDYGMKLSKKVYTARQQANYGNKLGLTFGASYSSTHTRPNDVVIHTPVSTEDAMILSLDPSRDQRTETPAGGADSLIAQRAAQEICPLDPALCEFRVLNCKYYLDTVLAEIDFESTGQGAGYQSGKVYNKTSGSYIPFLVSGSASLGDRPTFGTGTSLYLDGTRASLNFSDIGLTNDSKTTVLVEMDILIPSNTANGTMVVSFSGYDFLIPAGGTSGTWHTGNGTEKQVNNVNFINNKMRLGLQFSFGSIEDSKVFVNGIEQKNYTRVNSSNDLTGRIGTTLNFGSWGTNNNHGGKMYLDNIVITKKGGSAEHTEACYITTTTHHTVWTHVHTDSCWRTDENGFRYLTCNNLPLNSLGTNNTHVHTADCFNLTIFNSVSGGDTSAGETWTYNYTGSTQTFRAPTTGEYEIEAWGASGGDYSTTLTGGRGGYSKGTISLQAGEEITVTVGQAGTVGGGSSFGGGGASKDTSGTSGGGASSITKHSGVSNYFVKEDLNMRFDNARTGGGFAFLLNSATHTSDELKLSIKNNTTSTKGKIYFSNSYSFPTHKSIDFDMSLGDTDFKTYQIKLSDNPYWDGSDKYFNVVLVHESGASGTFSVNTVQLMGSTKESTVRYNVSIPQVITTGWDDYKTTHVFNGYNAQKGDIIEIKMKNASSNTSASLYYSPTSSFTADRSTTYTISSYDTTFKTYRIDTSTLPNWSTDVKSLRFHLLQGTTYGTAEIEYVRILSGQTTETEYILVAGGGGGASHNTTGKGGHGGGLAGTSGEYTGGVEPLGGTQTSGYRRGEGQPATEHNGGGGGGYWGGLTGSSYDTTSHHSGGGGGSGYLSPTLKNTETKTGENTGNGKITITSKITSQDISEGYAGYTWEELLGANWKQYITTTGGGPITEGTEYNFTYTGSRQTFSVPTTGKYKLELWGAQGDTTGGTEGGKGGYSSGTIDLQSGQSLNIYVGGAADGIRGGWNGGGTGGDASGFEERSGGGGGGSSDIRIGGTALTSRVIVAGGGGGAGGDGQGGATSGISKGTGGVAGNGGGTTGTDGIKGTSYANQTGEGGTKGTQSSGGTGGLAVTMTHSNTDGTYTPAGGGAGGGGYYGGGGGAGGSRGSDGASYRGQNGSDGSLGNGGNGGDGGTRGRGYFSGSGGGGAGGSGYVGGVTSGVTITGTEEMPAPTGGKETGHTGNGHIKITPMFSKPNVEINVNKMKSDLLTFPKVMKDGAPNPLYYCQYGIGGNGSLGAFDDTSVKTSGVILDKVKHPTSNKDVDVVRFSGASVSPSITSKKLGLVPNATYVLEFDYWTSGTTTTFNVGLGSSNLPMNKMTATKNVSHAKFNITSSNSSMANAVLNFYRDTSAALPTNIYITGIKLYLQPTYNQHVHNDNCIESKVLDCNEPHHSGFHYSGSSSICWDACGIDHNHVKDKDEVQLGGQTLRRGTFINLDYGFRVYFPNVGDFAQQPTLHGIPSVTQTRGLGYYNDMDTTQYTAQKRIQFDFNVNYQNTTYTAGEWISLPVNQTYYDFYLPLGNNEAVSAKINYEVIPINGIPTDNPMNENLTETTNRDRNSIMYAKHGASKTSYIDVVGRIGNFVISDTEDFRFSNLFKREDGTGRWVVEGLVSTVNSAMQNRYYGDQVDIRGESVYSNGGNMLNTWGSQGWLRGTPLRLPVNPLDNPVTALQDEHLKIGYDILADITTAGTYQSGVLRAIPYYYKLNLDSGTVTPLDVYTKSGDAYLPVSLYGGADDGSLPSNLAEFGLSMDWLKESERRNYTLDESVITDRIAEYLGEYILGPVDIDGDGQTEIGATGVKRLTTPLGNFVDLGNAQRVVADKRARTFIGTASTYGSNRNYNSAIEQYRFDQAAQRWHFKLGLPSSAVFVTAGQEPTKANLDATQAGNSVVLMTADIIVIGEVFTLRWDQPGTNSFSVSKNGVSRTFNLASSNIPPVIALYDLSESSMVDVTVKGSH